MLAALTPPLLAAIAGFAIGWLAASRHRRDDFKDVGWRRRLEERLEEEG